MALAARGGTTHRQHALAQTLVDELLDDRAVHELVAERLYGYISIRKNENN